MTESQVITLGGRAFQPLAESTLAHHEYYMGLVCRRGLHLIVRKPDETEPAYGLRLLAEMYATGPVSELVSGMLIPADLDPLEWTPEIAAEVWTFLKAMHDPNDLERYMLLALETYVRFFHNGQNSSASSQPYSPRDLDVSLLLDRMTAMASGAI